MNFKTTPMSANCTSMRTAAMAMLFSRPRRKAQEMSAVGDEQGSGQGDVERCQ